LITGGFSESPLKAISTASLWLGIFDREKGSIVEPAAAVFGVLICENGCFGFSEDSASEKAR